MVTMHEAEPTDAGVGPQLADVHAKLLEAERTYANAVVVERQASHAATEAKNRLNAMQQAFDAAVAAIRKRAPRDTDWSRLSRAES